MRELAVGPNAGDRVPHELADLLEGRGRIDPDAASISVTRTTTWTSWSSAAAGRAPRPPDGARAGRHGAPDDQAPPRRRQHHDGAGRDPGGRQAQRLAGHPLPGRDGRRRLPEHSGVGAGADPRRARRHEVAGGPGGHVRQGAGRHHGLDPRRRDLAARMHSARDYSGAEIMRTLRDEFRNQTIRILEFSSAVELVLDSKRAMRRGGPLRHGDRGIPPRPGQGGDPGDRRHGPASRPAVPLHQPLRRDRRRPGDRLSGGRPDGVHGRRPVPPDGCGLPGADRRPVGDREGPRARCATGQPRRATGSSIDLETRDTVSASHHPRVPGAREAAFRPTPAWWASGWIPR